MKQTKVKLGDSVLVSSAVQRSYKCRAIVTDLSGNTNSLADLVITKANTHHAVGFETVIHVDNLTVIKEAS